MMKSKELETKIYSHAHSLILCHTVCLSHTVCLCVLVLFSAAVVVAAASACVTVWQL